MATEGNVRDRVLQPLEDAGLQGFHFRTWLTAGMGFFTDAFDLFIIGVVTTLLAPLWHLTTLDIMVLNSTALFSAVLGALIFGRLMDVFGRKAIYGIEAMLLTGGALLSAFSMNIWMLIAFRFIVGLGVGGDYPMSGVLMSEYSNRKKRGFLVNSVFAMQGFGLLAGPALAGVLLASGMPHDLAWRLMLGLGAVPAAAVIYLRRTIAETAHFSLGARGDVDGAARLVEKLTNTPVRERGQVARLKDSWTLLFTDRNYLVTLVGTAFSWMFLDMAFYGNSVSSGLVMKDVLPHADLVSSILVSGLIFLVAAVPGYWVSAFTMDRLGRRFIQLLGFTVMGLAYAAIFLFPGVMAVPVEFLLLYAVSYFFIEFGPNCTTFVFPSEVFPVTVRGWGFGISASMGKLGAAVAAFLFPVMLLVLKVPGTMGVLAIVSFLGVVLTWLTLGETKGKTLREASQEHLLEKTA